MSDHDPDTLTGSGNPAAQSPLIPENQSRMAMMAAATKPPDFVHFNADDTIQKAHVFIAVGTSTIKLSGHAPTLIVTRAPPDPPTDRRVVTNDGRDPPGTFVDRIFRIFATKRYYELSVEPAIADMQYEYGKAMARGDRRRAFMILVEGYFGLGRPALWAIGKTVLSRMVLWIIRHFAGI